MAKPKTQSPVREADGLKTVPHGKPRRETQTKLRGRQGVVGDGMTGRFNALNKETCAVFSGSSCAVTPTRRPPVYKEPAVQESERS